MVQSCSVYNCTERYKPGSGSGISFHTFPQELKLRHEWILAMRRGDFQPSKHAKVCSKHFTAESFCQNPWSSKKSLRGDAVPTIFDFPSTNLTTDIRNRKLAPKPSEVNVNESIPDAETTATDEETACESLAPKKRRFAYIGDFNNHPMLSIDRQYQWTVNDKLNKKDKQIKVLQQSNRRLIQRNAKLKTLLNISKQPPLVGDSSSTLKPSEKISQSEETCELIQLEYPIESSAEDVPDQNSHTEDETDPILRIIKDRLKQRKPKDQFDNYGKLVAFKLRNLPNDQRILAEKLINEVLFMAEMGQLTMEHSIRASHILGIPRCNYPPYRSEESD